MATLIYRLLVVGLGTMALAGQVVLTDAVFWNALGISGSLAGRAHPAYASVVAVDAVLTLAMVVLAVVLVFHPRGGPGARPLGLAVAAWSYLLGYTGLITLLRPGAGAPAFLHLLFQTHFLAVEMVGLAALLRFSALFPRPLTPPDLRGPGTLAPGLGALQRLRRSLLGAAGPWVAAAGTTAVALGVNAWQGNPPPEAALLMLVDVARFAALSAVVLNLRLGYLLSSPGQRESARWLAVGFALLVGSLAALMGANVLTAVTGWRVAYFNWRPLILDLGLLGLVWCTAMGAFYRGPVRSGPVGRTVVLLAALVLSTLLLAAGLEALFSDALLAHLALPRGVGTLLATVATTSLFVHFAGPLGRLVDASVRSGLEPASEGGWASTG